MHFVKKVLQDKNDVRSNTIYVFECAGCGHDHFVVEKHLDINLQRRCPDCRLEDDSNEEKFLQDGVISVDQQIKDLTEKRNKIQARLSAVQAIKESGRSKTNETISVEQAYTIF
jgi:DNA replicative helicase MCM subunit Mcm2 (Cdc46/Mcm family)